MKLKWFCQLMASSCLFTAYLQRGQNYSSSSQDSVGKTLWLPFVVFIVSTHDNWHFYDISFRTDENGFAEYDGSFSTICYWRIRVLKDKTSLSGTVIETLSGDSIMTSGRDSDRRSAEKSSGSSDDRSGGHGTSSRGFASMDEEDKQREIASKGGKAAHEKGTAHEFDSKEAREAGKAAHEKGKAHEFTPDEAREAGRKGGHAAHEKGTAHEFSSEEAREAGRKGGESSHGRHGRGGSHGGDSSSSSTRGGTAGQHAKAGNQGHKNK